MAKVPLEGDVLDANGRPCRTADLFGSLRSLLQTKTSRVLEALCGLSRRFQCSFSSRPTPNRMSFAKSDNPGGRTKSGGQSGMNKTSENLIDRVATVCSRSVGWLPKSETMNSSPVAHRIHCLLLAILALLAFEAHCLAEMQTVVVLPFANRSKDPSLHWMSESFPELLEERLKWPGLNVLGREERLLGFDRIGIPYNNRLAKASMIKIGQELDASILLLGEFSSDGKEIDVSISVLDLKKNFLKAPLKENGALEQFQTVCGRLAWKVLAQLDPTFPLSLDAYQSRFSQIPNLAFENYIRGLIESDRARQIRFFRQADKAYPNYSKAIFQLGRVYHQEKDYATSSLWLQRLVRLDSEVTEACFLLGLNQLYLKNYDNAVAEFERLSRVIPLNEVHSNLGIAMSLKGAKETAVQALQKAIDGDPAEADYHFNLGYHLWKTGDFAGALRTLQQVAERDDSDSEAQYLLYKCYRALGKEEESKAAWESAKALSPKVENWETRRQMPDLFRIQSNFDEASFRQLQLKIQELQESKADFLSPQDRAARDISRASQLLAAGKPDEAEQLLAQIILRAPDSADARLVMGRVFEAKGEKERAVSELRASLWLRDSAATRVFLSRLYLELNRRSEAQAQAMMALKLEPGNREAQDLVAKSATP